MLTETALKSFIEVQFPVSKISKESYKERKAVAAQTLTGLGKWWGRKPTILVRAVLLGLLMPSSDDPAKDRQIFLKIMTMDEKGLGKRRKSPLPLALVESLLEPEEQDRWLVRAGKTQFKSSLAKADREQIQQKVFARLSYDEKLEYCFRPEEISGPSEEDWVEINTHLQTTASTLPDLIKELGVRKFGRIPHVGDAFCGGGSIPFEAARLGCEAFASDLNPVAAFLTWADMHIVGGGEATAQKVRKAQHQLYTVVDKQVTAWGIEHNEAGWRGASYLYCVEVVCPECGWKVPLAPSWIIAPKHRVVALLRADKSRRQFTIDIKTGATDQEIKHAEEKATIKDSYLRCPNVECQTSVPIEMVRSDRRTAGKTQYGLRMWEQNDIVPRPDDVFQERLYCIRWIETFLANDGRVVEIGHYSAPNETDLAREQKVLKLLLERFAAWQDKGHIPFSRIEEGVKTDEPIRTRGWTYWHQLFNPRQLLLIGLFSSLSEEVACPEANLLLVGKLTNFNSRLARWVPTQGGGSGNVKDVFSNQALNTLFNYGCRGLTSFKSALIDLPLVETLKGKPQVVTGDCRSIKVEQDIWITDPPYADAINYHELSEFFLAWYAKKLPQLFPDWYTDSRRALAVTGTPDVFRHSMVDCYSNLAQHMPDNGVQIVMFTHQDAAVWADLALILWASGLSVTSAWCIVTETNSALKEGNYVQGTVILVLRKQVGNKRGYMDEVYPEVQIGVKEQLASMQALEDTEDPNFTDTDYQLAAYAAALRVLTSYSHIGEINVAYELSKERKKGDVSLVEGLIDEAVRVACDYLVPRGFDNYVWKRLLPEERFYLKGLDIAKNGEHRNGAYQELARGFGIKEYKYMLGDIRANQAFLKTASGFGKHDLDDTRFGASSVRNVLFAIHEIVSTEDAQKGKNWLREIYSNPKKGEQDYWERRKALIEISRYLMILGYSIPEWHEDSAAARLLYGALENDHV